MKLRERIFRNRTTSTFKQTPKEQVNDVDEACGVAHVDEEAAEYNSQVGIGLEHVQPHVRQDSKGTGDAWIFFNKPLRIKDKDSKCIKFYERLNYNFITHYEIFGNLETRTKIKCVATD